MSEPFDGQAIDVEPRRRRRWVPAVVTLGVVLLLIVAGGGVFAFYVKGLADSFDSGTSKIPDAFPSEASRPKASTDGAQNILLMGSDSRGDATDASSTSSSNQRTDTLMLMHVSADRKDVSVMSIMRDLWVDIPGHGQAKINAAFAYGGTALTVQTVESLLGVRIDHVAIIDFEGFKDITTALGGVDVQSDRAFTAQGYSFVQGTNHLQGDAALAFVRDRHSFADADFQRVRNQQAFLRGVLEGVLNRQTLTNPAKISKLISSTAPSLSVDSGFTAETIGKLGFSLRDIRSSDVQFFTTPTAGTGVVGDQSVVLVDQSGLASLRDALAADDVRKWRESR